MSEVAVKKCFEYNAQLIAEKLNDGLKEYGGIESIINRGETVLLKPNSLSNNAPETGINTHPEFLRAVIRIVKQRAGKIMVGDSPGFGSFAGAGSKNGMKKVCADEDVELIEFKADTEINTPDKFFYGTFLIDSRVVKADKIISLPKIKTHMFMHMTVCVKNMFGLISGTRKLEYHAKAEQNRYVFAKMLVDLYHAKKPDFNIVDGIRGVEGLGPGTGGDPVDIGLILMGREGFAVDAAAADLCGIDPYAVYTNAVYREKFLNGKNIEYTLKGDMVEPFKMKEPPKEIQGGSFRRLVDFIRAGAAPKPVFNKKMCTGCRICVTHCPVNALEFVVSRKQGGKFNIIRCDYNKCIRCFCCHELCPDKAININKPFFSFMIK